MRFTSARIAGASFVALALVSSVVWAGKNGQTGASGVFGTDCNSCHNGGTAPSVALSGPTRLDAGSLAEYTFRVTTNAKVTGMGATVDQDDAVFMTVDGGLTKVQGAVSGALVGDVTHIAPTPPGDAGSVTYRFRMVAPPYGGMLTMYAAGNAANGDDTKEGDLAAKTTLSIQVDGPPRPPPAPPPEIDSSAPYVAPPKASAAVDAGVDAAKPLSASADGAPDESGCHVSREGTSPGDGLGVLALVCLVTLRRRSRALA